MDKSYNKAAQQQSSGAGNSAGLASGYYSDHAAQRRATALHLAANLVGRDPANRGVIEIAKEIEAYLATPSPESPAED